MRKTRLTFLVIALSLMLTGMAFAVDIPNISTWTQSMGVGGGSGGIGDLLIAPFYDVRNIVDPNLPGAFGTTSQRQYTLFSIVNTSDTYGVIARLRFREWKRSDEVLDIDIPLSCDDVWVGEVSLNPATGGGILRSPDRYITGPPAPFPSAVIGTDDADGLPFRIFDIPSDSVDTTDPQKYARTLYGYFEIIAEIRTECDMNNDGEWTQVAGDVEDVLFGNVVILRDQQAISHQYNMNAYSDFAIDPLGIWSSPQSGRPNLYEDVQGGPGIDWIVAPPGNPGIGGFDQLEAIMSKRYVLFQYVNGVTDGVPMSTSVVITFPTKHFHYDANFDEGGVAGWPPFTGNKETIHDSNTTPNQGGEIYGHIIYNRDEDTFQIPQEPISPPPPGPPPDIIPWEVNVVGLLPIDPRPDPFTRGWRDNLIISTRNANLGITYNEGWSIMDLSPDLFGVNDPRQADPARSQGKLPVTVFNYMGTLFPTGPAAQVGWHWPGQEYLGQYRGLPALGIVMTEFFNQALEGYYGNTVHWNYRAAFGEAPSQ